MTKSFLKVGSFFCAKFPQCAQEREQMLQSLPQYKLSSSAPLSVIHSLNYLYCVWKCVWFSCGKGSRVHLKPDHQRSVFHSVPKDFGLSWGEFFATPVGFTTWIQHVPIIWRQYLLHSNTGYFTCPHLKSAIVIVDWLKMCFIIKTLRIV